MVSGTQRDSNLTQSLPDRGILDFSVSWDAREHSALTEHRCDQDHATVVNYLAVILRSAVEKGASDVHFEPFENRLRIRIRIDGAFVEIASHPLVIGVMLVARLKVMANLNVAETRRPQDGKISFELRDRSVDIRMATLPSRFGESIALRILDQAANRLDLDKLGMPDEILERVKRAIKAPHGVFLTAGPTGSGKSTTLYSALKLLNIPESKLVTVEDPVEYELDGVVQVQTDHALGLDFSTVLRAFLRHDPDKILVGEIRDFETAAVAVQASLTGHMVFSSLHCGDASSAIVRMMDLKIEPYLIAASLVGVIAQRLLRRLDPSQREAWSPDPETLEMLNCCASEIAGLSFYRVRTSGMDSVDAYRGRLGLFEYLEVTDPFREHIARGASCQQLFQSAVDSGMIPLRKAALRLLLAGETTVDEVLRQL